MPERDPITASMWTIALGVIIIVCIASYGLWAALAWLFL